MRTFNKVFFIVSAVLMTFMPISDKEDAIDFAINRCIGYGMLWLMYSTFQGMEDEKDAKNAEIERLKSEQEELKRLIKEQEDAN